MSVYINETPSSFSYLTCFVFLTNENLTRKFPTFSVYFRRDKQTVNL